MSSTTRSKRLNVSVALMTALLFAAGAARAQTSDYVSLRCDYISSYDGHRQSDYYLVGHNQFLLYVQGYWLDICQTLDAQPQCSFGDRQFFATTFNAGNRQTWTIDRFSGVYSRGVTLRGSAPSTETGACQVVTPPAPPPPAPVKQF